MDGSWSCRHATAARRPSQKGCMSAEIVLIFTKKDRAGHESECVCYFFGLQ